MTAEKLITVILPQGRGMPILQALYERTLLRAALGAARAPVDEVRRRGGTVRPKRHWVEKDVLQVIVPADQAEEAFALIHETAGVGEAPGSFMFLGPLVRCSAFALPADLATAAAAIER